MPGQGSRHPDPPRRRRFSAKKPFGLGCLATRHSTAVRHPGVVRESPKALGTPRKDALPQCNRYAPEKPGEQVSGIEQRFGRFPAWKRSPSRTAQKRASALAATTAAQPDTTAGGVRQEESREVGARKGAAFLEEPVSRQAKPQGFESPSVDAACNKPRLQSAEGAFAAAPAGDAPAGRRNGDGGQCAGPTGALRCQGGRRRSDLPAGRAPARRASSILSYFCVSVFCKSGVSRFKGPQAGRGI